MNEKVTAAELKADDWIWDGQVTRRVLATEVSTLTGCIRITWADYAESLVQPTRTYLHA